MKKLYYIAFKNKKPSIAELKEMINKNQFTEFQTHYSDENLCDLDLFAGEVERMAYSDYRVEGIDFKDGYIFVLDGKDAGFLFEVSFEVSISGKGYVHRASGPEYINLK